jgi:hypothetical protein
MCAVYYIIQAAESAFSFGAVGDVNEDGEKIADVGEADLGLDVNRAGDGDVLIGDAIEEVATQRKQCVGDYGIAGIERTGDNPTSEQRQDCERLEISASTN